MRLYTVIRGSGRQVGCTVQESGKDGARVLPHCQMHSPTGFETGYAGSGPADLALSILCDFFGVSSSTIERFCRFTLQEGDAPLAAQAVHYHQQFKIDFIAGQELAINGAYSIREQEILDWLAKMKIAEKSRDRRQAVSV